MDSLRLRIFGAVAREGSVSGAARTLHCVQSNVTTRLRELEERLGTALFHRTGRGMQLTPAGSVLLDYAKRIERLGEEAEQAVRACGGEGGRLRLGAMETTTAVHLPALLSALQSRHPALELHVETGPSAELVSRVLDYTLDVAFVGGAVRHDALHTLPCFSEELVLARPHGGRPGPAQPTLLVFRQGCTYRAIAEQWHRTQGVQNYRLLEFGTLDGILGCVAAGLGVTLMPRSAVDRSPHAAALELQPIDPELGRIATHLVYRADLPQGAAMVTLRDLATGGKAA